jgi:hypothetical protein
VLYGEVPANPDGVVIFRAILVQVFSPKLVQAFSPKLVHLFSAIVVHSFSAKLGHDGGGGTPSSWAYFWLSEPREQEEICPERGKRPWRFERC